MFKINDKVVCVDDSPCRHGHIQESLKKGAIYVVRGGRQMRDGFAVFVVGIVGEFEPGGFGEAGWNPARFRLLSEVRAENRAKREQVKFGSHVEITPACPGVEIYFNGVKQ